MRFQRACRGSALTEAAAARRRRGARVRASLDPRYIRTVQARILVVEDDPQIAGLLTLELGRLRLRIAHRGHAPPRRSRSAHVGAEPHAARPWLARPRRRRSAARTARARRLAAGDLPHRARPADDRVGGLRAGADDYIVKPFDIARARRAHPRRAAPHRPRGPQRARARRAAPAAPTRAACLPTATAGASRRASCMCCAACSRTPGRVVTKAQLTRNAGRAERGHRRQDDRGLRPSRAQQDPGPRRGNRHRAWLRVPAAAGAAGVAVTRHEGSGAVEPAPAPRHAARAAAARAVRDRRRRVSYWAARHYADRVYDRWLYDSVQTACRSKCG